MAWQQRVKTAVQSKMISSQLSLLDNFAKVLKTISTMYLHKLELSQHDIKLNVPFFVQNMTNQNEKSE